jgi:hypothetical protein
MREAVELNHGLKVPPKMPIRNWPWRPTMNSKYASLTVALFRYADDAVNKTIAPAMKAHQSVFVSQAQAIGLDISRVPNLTYKSYYLEYVFGLMCEQIVRREKNFIGSFEYSIFFSTDGYRRTRRFEINAKWQSRGISI